MFVISASSWYGPKQETIEDEYFQKVRIGQTDVNYHGTGAHVAVLTEKNRLTESQHKSHSGSRGMESTVGKLAILRRLLSVESNARSGYPHFVEETRARFRPEAGMTRPPMTPYKSRNPPWTAWLVAGFTG